MLCTLIKRAAKDGLSLAPFIGVGEVPFMADVERWGVLTIGGGLGNARFTTRKGKTKPSK